MKNGMTINVSSKPLQGVSVRAMIQANSKAIVPAKMVAQTLDIARDEGATIRRKPTEVFDNSFAENLDKSGFMKELWGGPVPENPKKP